MLYFRVEAERLQPEVVREVFSPCMQLGDYALQPACECIWKNKQACRILDASSNATASACLVLNKGKRPAIARAFMQRENQ